ncbi:papilin b, proteoglycan-like sulfated glycoprotein precursor [Danio rerio]|uniref:Papilin b, proteoglycan-like sulfated glycoprotein n=1 Tax=Danio rerio TaxID=7955 RepID=Q503V4_DANRE|nr:papilin b, proteoglycan-like sulfated glycoprotein precursor [Danio rerio]AAH95166.1 Papilin b, proteoglycan-like sulfated glycoprotein [Danio rerio]AAI65723.1 Paplnb protein [Danio rerio]|eukprot:NP_001018400.1 papilin b, proteoglycan-like sulfated glycoprotein precursor [Danio rerio]
MMLHSLLGTLCLISAVFSLRPPSDDYYGEYGPYGPCSRTCGGGVAVRTRICNTMRTDGGHNCVGPSKSYKLCNTQECPAGSRDFREEQCSHFDQMTFQGKRYTWQPYYGASNPCELVCVPRGENFYYRHRPAVVDGTLCHVGRRDVCVEGVCRAVSHGEIVGFEDRDIPVTSRHGPGAAVHLDTYRYTYSAYSECSRLCGGGVQSRTVYCVHERTSAMVDESHCIAKGLRKPTAQVACNEHACAEYSAGPFGDCSVTCGEGLQTREVICVGGRGERLSEHHCSGLTRPQDTKACKRPACHQVFRYYTNDFSLCTRSCGTGTRERRVVCMDLDQHPYSDDRCASLSRPHAVENCNTQPCPGPQTVPSVQNPNGYESSLRGFLSYTHSPVSVYRPSDPYPTVTGPHCAQSHYGCCPDGHTTASGPRGEGCAHDDCQRSRYGCCLDGITAALGYRRAGCPDSSYGDHSPSASVCSLARDVGPCYEYKSRFYFDHSSGSCSQFWFGGCQGNGNNFVSKVACERTCKASVRGREPTSRRVIYDVRGYRVRSRA